ncbi:hypothetical protein ACOSP7_009319 [Xanthoceras sorbifolium]
MSSLHESTWNKAGIQEAIWSSINKIQRNNGVLTSKFHLFLGEATITLEDLLVSGASTFSRSRNKKIGGLEEKLKQARADLKRSASKKPDHCARMKKFKGSGRTLIIDEKMSSLHEY